MPGRSTFFSLLFLICCSFTLQAQDYDPKELAGLWKGTLYNDTTQLFLRYEIAISEHNGKLSGFSHTWFIQDDKQYYGVKKVKIKQLKGKIVIEDDGLITNNYPVAPAKGVRQLNILELSTIGETKKLTGPFTTNRTKEYHPVTGTINLEHHDDYWQSALVPHLEELRMIDQLSFLQDDPILKQREQQSIAVNYAATPVTPNNRNIIAANSQGKLDIPLPVEEKKKIPRDSVALAVNDPAPVKTEQVNTTENITRTKDIVKGTPAKKKQVDVSAKPTIQKEQDDNEDIVTASPKQKSNAAEKTAPVALAKPLTKKEAAVNQLKVEEERPKTLPSISSAPAIKTTISPASLENPAPERNLSLGAAEVFKRITLVQQTVTFHSDSLLLTLYDNGEIDGDTVSVVMNGEVIISKQRLSTNAVRKSIYIDPSSDSIQLVMYAENLGSIPPNTGLLVVKDGKDTYEIRFSGDLQKNAAIIFRRKRL